MQYQVFQRWQEAQLLLSTAEMSLLSPVAMQHCPVAMQQDSAALIYKLITMKGTVESYLYLITVQPFKTVEF